MRESRRPPRFIGEALESLRLEGFFLCFLSHRYLWLDRSVALQSVIATPYSACREITDLFVWQRNALSSLARGAFYVTRGHTVAEGRVPFTLREGNSSAARRMSAEREHQLTEVSWRYNIIRWEFSIFWTISFFFHFFFVPLSQVFPDGCKQPVLRHESLSAGWGCDFRGLNNNDNSNCQEDIETWEIS